MDVRTFISRCFHNEIEKLPARLRLVGRTVAQILEDSKGGQWIAIPAPYKVAKATKERAGRKRHARLWRELRDPVLFVDAVQKLPRSDEQAAGKLAAAYARAVSPSTAFPRGRSTSTVLPGTTGSKVGTRRTRKPRTRFKLPILNGLL